MKQKFNFPIEAWHAYPGHLGTIITGILATLLLASHPAGAQPANEPLSGQIITDGLVNTFAKRGNILYVGGTFNQAGIGTGGGAVVSATTGVPIPSSPTVNGSVAASIPDGNGGWFVGGAFTLAGGILRSNLVHILNNLTVDPAWTPATVGSVSALCLSGNTLYLGGLFTNVNGLARNRLAAIDATTGATTAWDPNANDQVLSLQVAGTNIYCAGLFTTIGNVAHGHLAAISAVSGAATSWNPAADDTVQTSVVLSNHLYVGGYFGNIGGQGRARLASFDLATGVMDAWNPGMGASSYGAPLALALGGYRSNIFVGGIFTSLGGSNRVNVAQVDAVTGAATSWDAAQIPIINSGFAGNYVTGLGIYSNVLYVGGPLANIGGQPRWYAAALDADTAAVLPWDVKADNMVNSFCRIGTNMHLGGLFSGLGCLARTNLAAFDLTTHQLTSWNPAVLGNSVSVNALAVAGDQIVVAGFFTNIAGVARTNLAAVDATSGAVHAWHPNPNAVVLALATYGDRLMIGGGFTLFDTYPMPYFAEVQFPSFNDTFWTPGFNSFVRTMAVDGNTLYAGGNFSSLNGVTRRRVAALDLPGYSLLSWDAQMTNGNNVAGLAVANGRVYACGTFNVVGGFNRTNFVALSASTAAVLPVTANTDQGPYAIAATSNRVFLFGNFSTVAGQKRQYCAAVDPDQNVLTPWNPNGDFYAKSAGIWDGVLYVGGIFLRLGGSTSRSIGAFNLSLTGQPAIVTNSLKRLPNGSMQLQLLAPGAAQATVQGSTNLTTWQPVQSVPLVGGMATYTDNTATNYGRRFYRLSVP